MKYLKMFVFALLLAFSGLYCNGQLASDVAGLGGPSFTPNDTTIGANDLTADETNSTVETDSVTADDSAIVTNDDASDSSGTTVKDDSSASNDATVESNEDGNSSDETVSTNETTTTEAELDPDNQKIAKPKVELDVTQGKWRVAPKKTLDAVSTEEYKENVALIKKTSKEVKELVAKIKAIRGDSSLAKADKKEKIVELRKVIKEKRVTIKKARNLVGYGRVQKGIYSPWAKQTLIANVSGVSKSGWYRIRVVAKNIYGPLPEFYKKFNITLSNETTGKDAGGLFIKASDKLYFAGSTLIYLEKGESQVKLLWTNDAYKKGEYDANIQIKNVTVRYAKAKNKRLKRLFRRASEYSFVDGRFFWDKNGARTYWANQVIAFNFPELKAGKYKVIVVAKQYGANLAEDYTNFRVKVEADGVEGVAEVPADPKKYKRGSVVLDLTGGNTDIYLTWTNDSYKKGVYDANIQIKSIKLKRVGDSERSAMAAYLLGAKSHGGRMIMFSILLGILMVLGGFYAYNKKKANAIR